MAIRRGAASPLTSREARCNLGNWAARALKIRRANQLRSVLGPARTVCGVSVPKVPSYRSTSASPTLPTISLFDGHWHWHWHWLPLAWLPQTVGGAPHFRWAADPQVAAPQTFWQQVTHFRVFFTGAHLCSTWLALLPAWAWPVLASLARCPLPASVCSPMHLNRPFSPHTVFIPSSTFSTSQTSSSLNPLPPLPPPTTHPPLRHDLNKPILC